MNEQEIEFDKHVIERYTKIMKNKNGFTLIELLVTCFIASIGLVMIAVLALCITFGVKGCKKVQSDGLKGVAEQVWEGTNAVAETEE